ncbi:MAG: nickel-dependent lactate racemase [Gemmatimonadetes bacterium]|nr:nickel-dependent lactate racemase [Gemmatimonadota bacterium]MYD24560.1 nickel-dependent lactate racemase [Gemmatimonadota bacterium]MYJ00263.1 nickel-dependent lactate racemase [Gemmatimonadota bacterium]
MNITLDYHKSGLEVSVPDENLAAVLNMRETPPLDDPVAATRAALQRPVAGPPLAEIARSRHNACVVVSDITRPVPHDIILPPLLECLERSGIRPADITLLVATGLHAPMDEEQLRETLTGDVVDRYPVVNHVARNGNEQADLGATSTGIPIRVDRRYVESDLKVLTGLIEAHFMAGYSGGRKLVAPGLVGVETIEHLHGPGILEHPNATTGVLDGNPLHEAALEIARRAGVDFILNVAMDEDRRVTGVFAGELDRAHRYGVRHVDGMVVASVEEPVDIVVTSSAGYPLDTTFYQAVKGMVGVLDILKEGGSIVIAAGCADGIGSAEFEGLLRRTEDIDAFIHWIQQPDVFTIDQWEIEELVKALKKGQVYLYTDGLSDEDARDCLVQPIPSVEAGIARALKRHGADATIAVVPRGPYVIPRVFPGQDAAG